MNRRASLTLVLLILAACAGVAIAQSARLTGEWDLTVTSPQGTREVKATFKEEGGKLSGTLGAGARSFPLEGTLTGNELKFSFTASNQGNDLIVTMTGQIEGDSIKGTADFGSMGNGEWTAKRAGAAPATAAAASPVGGQGGELSGEWDLTINSPVGTNNVQATVQHSGEKITGVMKGARGQLPFEGSVQGKEVKIVYTIQFEGNPMVITMTGTAEGDSIKGPADFGGLAQGDWRAQRKASSASQGSAASATGTSDKIDVSGTWIFEVETSAGSGSPTFSFTQQGEKLTGQYKGAFGEAALNGTVKGNAITFSFKVSFQGTEGTVTYTGTIEKDSMKGTATLGELGSATWTAKRQ